MNSRSSSRHVVSCSDGNRLVDHSGQSWSKSRHEDVWSGLVWFVLEVKQVVDGKCFVEGRRVGCLLIVGRCGRREWGRRERTMDRL